MQARIIMDDAEWERYKQGFTVGTQMHSPMVPPSFPVLVVSEVVNGGFGHAPSRMARHSFIEAPEMKRFLGLP